MQAVALIVDDEADLCKLMQIALTKMNIKSDVAYTLGDALDLLKRNEYTFCLTDLALPDGTGLDLVKKINATSGIPVAVITAHGTMDLAIDALKMGAFDFVNKPLEISRLRDLVDKALKASRDQKNAEQSEGGASPEDALLDARLIGASKPIQALRSTIKKLARSQAPVFLWGASGTGKEVVARLIHDLSPRREGNFVPVNCGAIPSELMESEFFGHKKGSFTGATGDKIGLFQQANGGTLFLDEVADLPLAMQVKLLRAIQEKTVRAIGDTKETPVDIRILSATHKDLGKLVQTGDFRQDLFYRINVIEVKLPTLNERRDDVALLAHRFLDLIASDWGIDAPTLSDDALQALRSHDFEGNVRELRNLLERAVTLCESHEITKDHLFADRANPAKPVAQTNAALGRNYQSDGQMGSVNVTFRYQTNASASNNVSLLSAKPLIEDDSEFFTSGGQDAKNAQSDVHFAQKNDEKEDPIELAIDAKSDVLSVNLPKEGLESYLQTQEKKLILAALAQAGNKTQAAKLLGMSFRSLRYRMKKLEIDGGDEIS